MPTYGKNRGQEEEKGDIRLFRLVPQARPPPRDHRRHPENLRPSRRRRSPVAACVSRAVLPKRRFRPPTAGETPAATSLSARGDFCGGLLNCHSLVRKAECLLFLSALSSSAARRAVARTDSRSPARRVKRQGGPCRISCSPQCTQYLFLSRRLTACVSAVHFAGETPALPIAVTPAPPIAVGTFSFTTSPHIGQKRTGASVRR